MSAAGWIFGPGDDAVMHGLSHVDSMIALKKGLIVTHTTIGFQRNRGRRFIFH